MPLVHIELLEGRSDEKKLAMIRRVTEAMAESLEIEAEEVDIIVREVRRKDWATGGVTWDRQG
ncbi:2-hydroxymuconate tautomerase [Brevibacillus sp. B_LB10_24]|uniref:2-hydroxymuconate tautomerase n=1 Tax=Brevibacillus sp. B_LB10_24 TaxID=3380645 RepID=UPI0038BC3F8C